MVVFSRFQSLPLAFLQTLFGQFQFYYSFYLVFLSHLINLTIKSYLNLTNLFIFKNQNSNHLSFIINLNFLKLIILISLILKANQIIHYLFTIIIHRPIISLTILIHLLNLTDHLIAPHPHFIIDYCKHQPYLILILVFSAISLSF